MQHTEGPSLKETQPCGQRTDHGTGQSGRPGLSRVCSKQVCSRPVGVLSAVCPRNSLRCFLRGRASTASWTLGFPEGASRPVEAVLCLQGGLSAGGGASHRSKSQSSVQGTVQSQSMYTVLSRIMHVSSRSADAVSADSGIPWSNSVLRANVHPSVDERVRCRFPQALPSLEISSVNDVSGGSIVRLVKGGPGGRGGSAGDGEMQSALHVHHPVS